jgi:serine/threonine protein kinase
MEDRQSMVAWSDQAGGLRVTLQRQAYEIFKRATDVPKTELRIFLAQECAQNVELRKQVEELLSLEIEALDLLPDEATPPPMDVAEQLTSGDGQLDTRVGPYKLLHEIGEGGFGVVYMAVQTEPVRREVALKIIKPGMDTREVIARFESERQALALMDHPNIAHVFDAGQTENDRPYFVMELVKGIPITEFCDKNNLNTTERLELFMTVCQAVQHAHQKGVIHRDLKPSNIMVTLDGAPSAKVIDFGVSKSIAQRLTEKRCSPNTGR